MKIRILKVGDKVKITEDLSCGRYRDTMSSMYKYAGHVGTIVKKCGSLDGINYKLDIDDERYFWYPDALTLVE